MIYFLSGNDWFRLQEEEHLLREKFRARFPHSEETFFECGEDFPDKLSLVRDLLAGGLFRTPVSLIFRSAKALSEQSQEELQRIFADSSQDEQTMSIVVVSGKVKKSDTFFDWLVRHGERKTLDHLDGLMFERYARELLARINNRVTIEPEALRQLLLGVHGEAGRLFQELTKLSLFRNTGSITLADVRLLSVEPLESEVFAALDALVRGDRERAVTLFRKEEKVGVPVERTLGLVAWQLRRLLEIQEVFQGGITTASGITKELGMKSDFSVRKVLPRLSLFPLSRLKRGITILADLDLATKTSAMAPGVGLDLFVWKF